MPAFLWYHNSRWAGKVVGQLLCRRLNQLQVEEKLECQECSALCEKVVYPAACLKHELPLPLRLRGRRPHVLRVHREGLPARDPARHVRQHRAGQGRFRRRQGGAPAAARTAPWRCRAASSAPKARSAATCTSAGATGARRRPSKTSGRRRGSAPVADGILLDATIRSSTWGRTVSTWADRGRSSKPRSGGLVKLPEQHNCREQSRTGRLNKATRHRRPARSRHRGVA